MSEERRYIWERLGRNYMSFSRMVWIGEELDIRFGYTDFSSIRERLQEIEDTYGDRYDAFRVCEEQYYDYGDTTPSTKYVIEGGRLETDEEVSARIAAEKQRVAEREQREREEYERLSQKFAKDTEDE